MPFECFLLLHGDTAMQKLSVITRPPLLRVSSQQSIINVPQVLSWHSVCCDKAISCIFVLGAEEVQSLNYCELFCTNKV